MSITAEQVQAQLTQTQSENLRLSTALDTLRSESHAAITQLRELIDKNGASKNHDRFDLLDMKAMAPGNFGGGRTELFSPWTKKIASWLNAKKDGFRKALEWAQDEELAIDHDGLTAMNWEFAEVANAKLYDFLYNVCTDDALRIVEAHKDMGFEAWRQLLKRYRPTGGSHALNRMTQLLQRKRCKDLVEMPSAVDQLEKDIRSYEQRGGTAFPEEWKSPLLLQLIPEAYRREFDSKFIIGEKDYTKMRDNIVGFSNEQRFTSTRSRNDMDVDLLERMREITDECNACAEDQEYSEG